MPMQQQNELMPLGLLGGTFDPVHFGHLRLAEEAREALDLPRILWIPSGQPPHRSPPRANAADRLAMVRLGIADNPHFVLDDAEADAATPSYTVLTLERLRARYGKRPLVLLLGGDAFLGLPTWHRWHELFDLAHIAVATRPGYELAGEDMAPALAAEFAHRLGNDAAELKSSAAGRIVPFAMTPLSISASLIRARLAAGLSARYLIPAPVREYIDRQHLYRIADGR
jgi:nicotinate-nucleotide adenylyltransferase